MQAILRTMELESPMKSAQRDTIPLTDKESRATMMSMEQGYQIAYEKLRLLAELAPDRVDDLEMTFQEDTHE